MARETDLFDETFTQIARALSTSITNQDWLNSWRQEITDLQAIKHSYHDALRKVLSSDELTPIGRDRRKGQLQAEFAKAIDAHHAQHIDGLQPHLDQLRRKGIPKDTPTDTSAILRFLQLQEIRSELKGMDPLLLRAEYESRAADTSGQHDNWLEAVESAPTPLLPGEVLDRGRASRTLRALEPKDRQSLSDLTSLRDATAHLLSLARRELPAPDLIAEIAQGMPAELESDR